MSATDPRPSAASNLPHEQMTARHRVCGECGHLEAQHYGFGWPGHQGCTVRMDTRPPSVGGPDLTPCKCKGFRL